MTLADFVDINPRTQLTKGSDVPFVGMDAVTAGRRKVLANERRAAGGSGAKFQPKDTLFARITPCLENGKIAQYLGDESGFGSTEFFVLRAKPKISDPDFVYYFSLQHELRSAAEKSMTGASGRQRADVSSLIGFECNFPPLSAQQRIAGILSAYDELIENSQRRIKILEQMARNLYREWFVHFRFPNHAKTPMVNSPLGKIPKGWEVKRLDEVAAVNRAQINARNAPESLHYIDISSVSQGQIDLITPYGFSDAPGRARRIVQHGDILWSCVRPNRRSHALVMQPVQDTIASTGFAVLTAMEVPFAFLYQETTTDDFVAYLTNNATGSAYPAVTATTFEKAELLIPAGALLKKFEDVATPMADEIYTLQHRIQNLRKTRDLLLPRLLSGQIEIKTQTN